MLNMVLLICCSSPLYVILTLLTGDCSIAVSTQHLTGPTSQNYGAAVDATHAKKAKL